MWVSEQKMWVKERARAELRREAEVNGRSDGEGRSVLVQSQMELEQARPILGGSWGLGPPEVPEELGCWRLLLLQGLAWACTYFPGSQQESQPFPSGEGAVPPYVRDQVKISSW